ncbi:MULTISPECIES: KGG domain-containing protein [Hymenobacter]|uniref:KGG domain-containing protein n=1 Tax=Hymenobacter TaxID=89966 RepID=UPI000A48C3C5|nr:MULTISPECIES: KGG domain-containing protein [Hymenobacter]MCC3152070.1 hypothetical protein [Hymenobacter sp. BT770]MDO3415247.1 KGG domain-containing protein [Hymenobacter sp. BT770]
MANKERKHGTSTEQQSEAGKKGGQANRGGSNTNSGNNNEQNREAGRKGGQSSQGSHK